MAFNSAKTKPAACGLPADGGAICALPPDWSKTACGDCREAPTTP